MRNQLITIFDGIKDPRKIDRCVYELGDLMAIALLTYLAGKKDYADMEFFAKHSARKFGLLPYTEQSPSRDTFERLFGILKTDCLEQCVVEHGRRIMDLLAEKQIVLDGKKECGKAPREKGPKGGITCSMSMWLRTPCSSDKNN